jgi:hypothetical protein
MSQDLASQSPEDISYDLTGAPGLEKFIYSQIAKAVEAEREACAKIAMDHVSLIEINEPIWHEGQDWASQRIADAIRARKTEGE